VAWVAVLEITYGHLRISALNTVFVWLFVQIPLWVLRARWGIGLVAGADGSQSSPVGEDHVNMQRALLRVFGWTMLMGLVAWLLLAPPLGIRPFRLRFPAMVGLQAMLFTLGACVVLAPRLMPRLVVAGLATCFASLMGLQILSQCVLLRRGFEYVDWGVLQHLPLLAALLYLRTLQYRLGKTFMHS